MDQGLLFGDAPKETPRCTTLEELAATVASCKACRLHENRTKTVFGSGNPDASLVFVGEGPGRNEDEQGLPFVGRAGELLTRMIEAIDLTREEVFICNVVKCRPPGNRTPEPDEIESCRPHLRDQIRLIRPKLLCALGAPAMRWLTGRRIGINQARGQVFSYEGVPVLPTFHPAYLLRDPRKKPLAWDDLKRLRRLLEEQGGCEPPDATGAAREAS